MKRRIDTTTTATILGLLAFANLPSLGADELPAADAPTERVSIELAFKTHLDMGLPEQDVFIERVPGSGVVYRVTNADHDMTAELFKAAVGVPHDPFSTEAVGPHPKGPSTGLTLGEWLRHAGRGTYTCENGQGRLELSFSGLVPQGVYTMWHAFMALPPPVPFTGTLDLPLGARDGSESVFVAGADGAVEFSHTFTPCLQMSDVWTTSMLAINWHSDGKTYGGHPGDFGSLAHIPLFVMLPPREGL